MRDASTGLERKQAETGTPETIQSLLDLSTAMCQLVRDSDDRRGLREMAESLLDEILKTQRLIRETASGIGLRDAVLKSLETATRICQLAQSSGDCPAGEKAGRIVSALLNIRNGLNVAN